MSLFNATNRDHRSSRRPIGLFAALILIAVVALGAGRASQDLQRVNRLELVDAQGSIAMVLNVSTSGNPRVSIINNGAASVFEFTTDEIRIVTPVEDAAEEDPQVQVSRLPLGVLHALAGGAADSGGEQAVATDEADSLMLRIQYLQEQVDSLRQDQRHLEREHEQDQPRGRDTSDPLRLQRVIDELQRETRDLQREVNDSEREISDLTRRVRSIEMKIRE